MFSVVGIKIIGLVCFEGDVSQKKLKRKKQEADCRKKNLFLT